MEELEKEYQRCLMLADHYADSRAIGLCEKYKQKAWEIKQQILRKQEENRNAERNS